MTFIRTIIRKGTLLVTAALIAGALPLATFPFSGVSADNHSDTGCDIPASSTYGAGTHVPTGDDAQAFTYVCADPNNPDKQFVGDWLSAQYYYVPAADKYHPITPVTYTYNPSTGLYDFSKWVYQTDQGKYVQKNGSTATPPSNVDTIIVGTPAPATTSSGSGSNGATPDTATNTASPDGSNTINNNQNNSVNSNNNNTVGVTNDIGSTAVSGNAVVLGNTTGGSATSGSALAQATVINNLQSTSNALGSGNQVATFTYNIDGDVNGDLLFDPASISDVQGNSAIDNNLNNNLIVNNSTDASITNNLDLNAQSGDATVADNTSGGNATTGSATTIANVVNSIQSIITSGKSFIGTININGNLNGDILLPANFVDQLLADNIPTVNVSAPQSTNTVNDTTNNNVKVTNTNNLGITNNTNAQAASGNASVKDNTSGGNATSGSANNNLVAFNLTGSQVVGTNDLLVFVNVLGTWTGLIVNAPAGATAAELGGGITQSGPNSTNSVDNTVNNNADVTNTTNETITNNINSNAQSGNAKVKDNTSGGDATSGDASNAVNLMNIEGSTINLSNWFGILFINVFGSWNGSFGVNTSAGDVANAVGSGGTLVGGTQFVQFIPGGGSGATGSSDESSDTTTAPQTDAVLAAHTEKTTTKYVPTSTASTDPAPHKNFWVPAIGTGVAVLMLAAERIRSIRRPNN